MSVLYTSAPAFVDALPKDVHTPEASKPAEAILWLNKLFDVGTELEARSPDQKKKERFICEKPLLEALWARAENCIRPSVIGSKYWLFAGRTKGAAASAGLYTLVETAKANGLAQ